MKNKGITLIALVITIIVLLILAAVSIATLTGENGILTQASTAKSRTEKANIEEQLKLAVLSSRVNSDGADIDASKLESELTSLKANKVIDSFTAGATDSGILYTATKESYEFEITEVGEVSIVIRRLQVGDYIDYTPDSTSISTYSSTMLYQDITQDQLEWQILRIYDDGSMDLIGSVTSKSADFGVGRGYNNGVYLMNDICKSLYSRSGIEARSVKIEDFEYWITDDGKAIREEYMSSGGVAINRTKTYEIDNSHYPALYAEENGSGIDTEITKKDGISASEEAPKDTANFPIPTDKGAEQATTNGLTVTQTYWDLGDNNINETNFGDGAKALYSSKDYWVASRIVDCREEGYARLWI